VKILFLKYLYLIVERISMFKYLIRYSFYKNKYNIESTFRFNGEKIKFYGDGQICLGDKSYIGELSSIQACKGQKVVIGKNCRISHNVRIYTSSPIANQDFSQFDNLIITKGDVVIGNNVWIGVNVYIGPKVKIGNDSVIAANSVITKDVESSVIIKPQSLEIINKNVI